MKMTKEEREAARERCEAATGGPWQSHMVPMVFMDDGESLVASTRDDGWGRAHGEAQSLRDAHFIAHARADLPRALDTIDALEAEVDDLSAELGELQAHADSVWEAKNLAEKERDSLHELNKTMKRELTSELRASEFLNGTLYLVAVTAVAYLRQGKTAEAMAELEQVTDLISDRWSEEEGGQ